VRGLGVGVLHKVGPMDGSSFGPGPTFYVVCHLWKEPKAAKEETPPGTPLDPVRGPDSQPGGRAMPFPHCSASLVSFLRLSIQ